MSKKLAIKGHATRGNEIIEILKMLGGSDNGSWWGNDVGSAYFINDWTQKIDVCTVETDIVVFTLEEFLKEYPFKVGDKVTALFQSDKTATNGFCSIATVTIKSMRWSEDCETMVYDFEETEDVFCAEDLKLYKEDSNMKDKEDKLFDSIVWHLRNSINNGKQDISGGDCERYFRELVDKVKGIITPSPDITAEVTDKNNCDIGCPDGYEFYDEKGNLIGTKVMMKPKKPKYPTTYEECCEFLGKTKAYQSVSGYKTELLEDFQKILICRDAYWKIAGEEMGLGKSWEPDWNDSTPKYTIVVIENELVKRFALTQSYILAFPTEEIRDIFYENFKDLIEQCKELL